MKVVSSIGSLKNRSKDCQIVKEEEEFMLFAKVIQDLK